MYSVSRLGYVYGKLKTAKVSKLESIADFCDKAVGHFGGLGVIILSMFAHMGLYTSHGLTRGAKPKMLNTMSPFR